MLSLYFTMIFYIILHMIISLFSTVETSPENIQEQRSTFDVLLGINYTSFYGSSDASRSTPRTTILKSTSQCLLTFL